MITTAQWLSSLRQSPQKRPLPVLSFPGTQLLGCPVSRLVQSSTAQAEVIAAVAERCPMAAAVSPMDLSVEAEAFGAAVRFADDEVPTVLDAPVKTPRDAQTLPVPAVGSGRTGVCLDAAAAALRLLTDRPLLAGTIGPFSLAGRLMGMSELMMAAVDEEEYLDTLLETCTAFLTDYLLAYKALGVHGVVVAEPTAGLLSPSVLTACADPWMRRLIAAVQDEHFAVIYHNCGPSTRLALPELSSLGAAGYHFGDSVDMAAICAAMPGDALLMGNLSPAKVLASGTPDSVYAETARLLHRCAADPRFVLSSGCDIPPQTPWANIDAFFAAWQDFTP